jgi:hypothetical protein
MKIENRTSEAKSKGKSKVQSRRLRDSSLQVSTFRLLTFGLLVLLTFNLRLSTALAQTNYTEPWTSSLDGWSYVQTACTGTCGADALLTSDGNPADSVHNVVSGRNKDETGYWHKSLTWQAMGVPAGDTVDTVDGQWDDFSVCTAVACASTHQVGIQLYNSGDTAEITASTVEPLLTVAGDTSSWTTHNPTGAVNVNAGSQASTTTVSIHLNVNPSCGNNGSAAAEIRGDNFKLTIVSHSPSTGVTHRRVIRMGTMVLRMGQGPQEVGLGFLISD